MDIQFGFGTNRSPVRLRNGELAWQRPSRKPSAKQLAKASKKTHKKDTEDPQKSTETATANKTEARRTPAPPSKPPPAYGPTQIVLVSNGNYGPSTQPNNVEKSTGQANADSNKAAKILRRINAANTDIERLNQEYGNYEQRLKAKGMDPIERRDALAPTLRAMEEAKKRLHSALVDMQNFD